MDKLKEHIKKNRAKLDQLEQPNLEKIWAGIQQDLSKDTTEKPANVKIVPIVKGKRFNLWGLVIAASVALLIGVGVGYLLQPKIEETTPFNLANYAPELVEEAKNYQQLVHEKMTAINIEKVDTLAFAEIIGELKQLDSEYDHWTTEVPQYVHEQELLEFLQRHYERKIRILEILSKEIEKKAYYEEREIRL